MTRLNPAILGAVGVPPPPPLGLSGSGQGVGLGVGQLGLIGPEVDMFANGQGVGLGVGTFQQVSPPGSWPDPFMSYPASAPIILDGEVGTVIEYRSFDRNARRDLGNPRPITLLNCSDITIRRIDTRGCTMGLLYAFNSTNITMEFCRAENIGEELDFAPFVGNSNDLNFYQLNACNGFTIRDCKGRYGNTEDVISQFDSSNGLVERFEWEGATLGNEPTSDGSPAIRWRSASNTGGLLGDGGSAVNVTVRDSTFLNPGQVGIGIAGGVNMRWENCVSMSERASTVSEFLEKPSRENIAAYALNFYGPSPCSSGAFINCRTRFANGDNYFADGSCGVVDQSGTVWGDPTLDANDYRVVL